MSIFSFNIQVNNAGRLATHLRCPGPVWEQHADADPGVDAALQPLALPTQLQLPGLGPAHLAPGDGDQRPPGGEEGLTGHQTQKWAIAKYI